MFMPGMLERRLSCNILPKNNSGCQKLHTTDETNKVEKCSHWGRVTFCEHTGLPNVSMCAHNETTFAGGV